MARKKLVVKTFRSNTRLKHNLNKIFVITYNKNIPNGFCIQKIGVLKKYNKVKDQVGFLDLEKLGMWLNKGLKINRRTGWLLGYLMNQKNKIK